MSSFVRDSQVPEHDGSAGDVPRMRADARRDPR